MTLHDTLTCTIETLAYGGDGIARVDGRVLFIPETIPSEIVRVRVTQMKKHFARAEVLDLITPSPRRISPCCRITDSVCGELFRVPGCVYDHIDYAEEVNAKQHQLKGFFRRLPQIAAIRFGEPFLSPSPLHYRNKIVLHAQHKSGVTHLGYRQEPSHRVLDIPACPLACREINGALSSLRASARFQTLQDNDRVTFRHTAKDGAVWWVNNEIPHPPCAECFTEASPSGPLRVPRDGFYQINPSVSHALVRTVSEWFAEELEFSELLDLYCGVGVFGFACMQAGGTRLTGIESGRAAIAAAKQNAEDLGIPGVFWNAALGQEPVRLLDFIHNRARTTAIVDPPRDGLAPALVHDLAACGLPRLFYVSCDPATLARDLDIFMHHGYRISRIRLFDMFPRTAHFETLAELRH